MITERFLESSKTFKDIAKLFNQIGFVLKVEDGELIAIHIDTMNKSKKFENHQWRQFLSYHHARYFALGYISCKFQYDL